MSAGGEGRAGDLNGAAVEGILGGGRDTPYSGLYREALPESGAFFKLAVY